MKCLFFLAVSILALAIGQTICWATNSFGTLFFLIVPQYLMAILGFALFAMCKKRRKVQQRQEQAQPAQTAGEWIDQALIDAPSIGVFLERVRTETSSPEAVDNLKAELLAGHQAFAWSTRMYELFYPKWRAAFEQTPLPLDIAEYPRLRGILYEVALHTMDYVRYRCGDINVTNRHKVNPAALLLRKSFADLPTETFSDDPMKTPRDVRMIGEILLHDGVQLQDATIMGYQLDKDNN